MEVKEHILVLLFQHLSAYLFLFGVNFDQKWIQ